VTLAAPAARSVRAASLHDTAHRRRNDTLERHGLAALFLTPGVLLFTIFVMLPMIEAAWYSLYRWNGYGSPTDYVGLRNYATLFGNSVFHSAMWNTMLVVFVSLLVQLPLALGLALLIADRFAGSYLFRTIFFLPYILGEVVAGLIWRFVFDGNFGLAAGIAHWLGVDPPYILADPGLALIAIMVVVVWKYFGFHMMIYIAGLQDIPHEIREAAAIDGANRWQTTTRIVLSMLAPSIKVSVFFSVVGALQLFDVIMPLTGGGPSNTTHTLVTFQYNFGITRMNIGFGSAVGVVLFILCIGFTLIYRRYVLRDRQHA
jgi:raffinose/stachyose/melibiose transport system permease protein